MSDRKPVLHPDAGLLELLDFIDEETGDGHISVGDIISLLGPRSLIPLLLLPCLAMVSPLSAVPGVPSVLSAIVGLVAVQLLIGQKRLWLPDVILRRSLHAERVLAMMLRRVDPFLHKRLIRLTDRPGNLPALC